MFLDMVLRSVWRHRIRSFLTAFGIVLAIAAIVSLGSISEGINSMAEEQMKLASKLVMVVEKGGGNMQSIPGLNSRLDMDMVDEIGEIEGVEAASPTIRVMEPSSNLFISGVDLENLEMFNLENIEFKEGGWPEEGSKELVLGYSVAEAKDLGVGDEVKLRGEKYSIVGILKESKSFIDYAAIGPYKSIAETYGMESYASVIVVKPADVKESDRIADEIEERYSDVDALTTSEMIKRAKKAIDQLRIMTLAIGIISSIVAAIGIINTMMMIVTERKREFGIMKALGAEGGTILMMVIEEGLILAIAGGVVGIIVGYLGTDVLNSQMGFPIASVTPRLALLSFIYGILIAVIASLYPAYQAVSVDPIEAIRNDA